MALDTDRVNAKFRLLAQKQDTMPDEVRGALLFLNSTYVHEDDHRAELAHAKALLGAWVGDNLPTEEEITSTL